MRDLEISREEIVTRHRSPAIEGSGDILPVSVSRGESTQMEMDNFSACVTDIMRIPGARWIRRAAA